MGPCFPFIKRECIPACAYA